MDGPASDRQWPLFRVFYSWVPHAERIYFRWATSLIAPKCKYHWMRKPLRLFMPVSLAAAQQTFRIGGKPLSSRMDSLWNSPTC